MRPLRLAIMCLAFPLALFMMNGCGGSDSESPDATQAPATLVEYTTRGRIVQLPDPDRPATEFILHHEPIPSYESGGRVIGMAAMQMPFPLADGVSVEGLSVGDIVRVTFEVEYDPERLSPIEFRTTRIEPLPADTELVYDAPENE